MPGGSGGALSAAIAVGSSAMLALISFLWYNKSADAQKLEEELAQLRTELAKVPAQKQQLDESSKQAHNLKLQIDGLRADIERTVSEKKAIESSVNRQIRISNDSAREAAEAKVTAELARDELVAENHKLTTQIGSLEDPNSLAERMVQKRMIEINTSTQQLRDQNQKLAAQLAIEQSHKNVAIERVKEVEQKFEMIRSQKENQAASAGVTRFLSRKNRNDLPLISPRDRPLLSPRESRVNVQPQSMSPSENYRKTEFGAGLDSSIDAGYSTYDSVSPSAMQSPPSKQSYRKNKFGAGLDSSIDAGYSTYDSVSPGAMNTPEKSSRSESNGGGTGIGWTP